MDFPAFLKQARESAKLTQEELAVKSGVKRSFIALLESDRRTPPMTCLTQLSAALGLSRRQHRQMLELAALRHIKPDFRPILEHALARLNAVEARLDLIESGDKDAEQHR